MLVEHDLVPIFDDVAHRNERHGGADRSRSEARRSLSAVAKFGLVAMGGEDAGKDWAAIAENARRALESVAEAVAALHRMPSGACPLKGAGPCVRTLPARLRPPCLGVSEDAVRSRQPPLPLRSLPASSSSDTTHMPSAWEQHPCSLPVR